MELTLCSKKKNKYPIIILHTLSSVFSGVSGFVQFRLLCAAFTFPTRRMIRVLYRCLNRPASSKFKIRTMTIKCQNNHSSINSYNVEFVSTYHSVLEVQMKNWDPLVLGPALAIDKIPTMQ